MPATERVTDGRGFEPRPHAADRAGRVRFASLDPAMRIIDRPGDALAATRASEPEHEPVDDSEGEGR